MKALYFPYSSPTSYGTILRSLLVYEEIGAICPKDFFLTDLQPDGILSTQLEKAAAECRAHSGTSPISIVDPVDLIKGNEVSFVEGVIADMKNPVYLASAPRGRMLLYATKLSRPLFETFRDKIKQANVFSTVNMSYREGPYQGTEHFMWEVEEPLAHSILLNLTHLGLEKTDSVPITDNEPSHLAYLAKTSGTDRTYDLQIRIRRLVRLAFPSGKNLNVRNILDFRDNHKKDLRKLWQRMTEQESKLNADSEIESDDLFLESRLELEVLKNSIKNDWNTFKWGIAVSVAQLVIGTVLRNPGTIATSPLPVGAAAARYVRNKERRMPFSYLLSIEDEL